MEPLQIEGVTTLQVFTPEEVSVIRDTILDIKFPEFREIKGQLVLGGFGALGNPSSHHHPYIRGLRRRIYDKIHPVFKGDGRNLEMIIDRLMIRLPGQVGGTESWHRDEAVRAKTADTVFGGWVNFDLGEQIFSCVPGSHTKVLGTGGFARIDKSEHKELKSRSTQIKIPAGAIVIFNENIIHEVYPHKKKHTMMRLFVGWRLTNETEPLIPNIHSLLKDQAPIPLKSGQMPEMFSKSHLMFHLLKLEKFAETLHPLCTYDHTFKSGKKKGQTHKIPVKIMPSLREIGALYPEYSDEDKSILVPHSL
tara:strand:- start:163 stop:1083 length:921 start_codon:yes stop_codon:yes gene_type:complete